MGNAWDMLDRIQRVKVRREDGTARAEVTLEGMNWKPECPMVDAKAAVPQPTNGRPSPAPRI